jgi:NAD(P)H dehydrogenase (quinone)
MSTFIVTAHPEDGSLTHQAALRLQELLGADVSGVGHLAQEGFDPRFTANDRQIYLGRGTPDQAISAEQERLEEVSDVVLVFPVYWWSMPALLKGWIDRVFVAGWAFDYDENGSVVPKLGRLAMHLLPISGTTPQSFAKHGYAHAFSTQIEHGVIDFCGIKRGTTAFIYDSESTDNSAVAAGMEAAATLIASNITKTIRT